MAKIEGLQRQVDELKKVAARPGPQGPPGRLPLVKEYVADRVHYEADVIAHAGALWQARGDTVHPPPHADWICLAWAGRDAQTPTIRGTYDDCEKYKSSISSRAMALRSLPSTTTLAFAQAMVGN